MLGLPDEVVGAFVRQAIPNDFLHHTLQFEEDDFGNYYTVTSPYLPLREPLVIISWGYPYSDAPEYEHLPKDAEGRTWYIDYEMTMDTYMDRGEMTSEDLNRWTKLCEIPPLERQNFSSPRQAAMVALKDPVIQRRIKKYRRGENVDNQVHEFELWDRRIELITDAMGQEGWRPRKVGFHKGSRSLFAIAEHAAETSAEAIASAQRALDSVGMKSEGIQVARRGGESGPWQVEFNLLCFFLQTHYYTHN